MRGRKKGSRVFEIFSSQGHSEFVLGVSRARWDVYQRMLVKQDEESRKRVQVMDWGGNQSWAAICQSIARRMLSCLDNSEALKVSTEELKEQVLSPSEPSVNIQRIVRQAKNEKHK